MPHVAIVDPIPPPAETLAQLLGLTTKELLEKIQQIANDRRKKS